MWYSGASVTVCARKIRNSWCSCPCCSRQFKITWRTWDPTIIMSTRWSYRRARLHQNMHAPPGKATPQHKSQERLSTNTDSEMTKLILFKHQWTNATQCHREINWFWLDLFPDWYNFQPKIHLSIYIYYSCSFYCVNVYNYVVSFLLCQLLFSQVAVTCRHFCCLFFFAL